jgi:hypothetical protein
MLWHKASDKAARCIDSVPLVEHEVAIGARLERYDYCARLSTGIGKKLARSASKIGTKTWQSAKECNQVA